VLETLTMGTLPKDKVFINGMKALHPGLAKLLENREESLDHDTRTTPTEIGGEQVR